MTFFDVQPGIASTIPYFFLPKFRNHWSPVCPEETDWPFCIFGLIKIQLTLKLRQWLGYAVGSVLKHFRQSMSYTFLAVKNKLSGIHTQQTHFLIIVSSLVATLLEGSKTDSSSWVFYWMVNILCLTNILSKFLLFISNSSTIPVAIICIVSFISFNCSLKHFYCLIKDNISALFNNVRCSSKSFCSFK